MGEAIDPLLINNVCLYTRTAFSKATSMKKTRHEEQNFTKLQMDDLAIPTATRPHLQVAALDTGWK
jgi:hypothetical protein